ncbi:hypothetical protein SCANM124S_07383 [Streptomyces canus]
MDAVAASEVAGGVAGEVRTAVGVVEEGVGGVQGRQPSGAEITGCRTG